MVQHQAPLVPLACALHHHGSPPAPGVLGPLLVRSSRRLLPAAASLPDSRVLSCVRLRCERWCNTLAETCAWGLGQWGEDGRCLAGKGGCVSNRIHSTTRVADCSERIGDEGRVTVPCSPLLALLTSRLTTLLTNPHTSTSWGSPGLPHARIPPNLAS